MDNKAIGLIKFTPNTSELANDSIFYLSKVDNFLNQSSDQDDKINDLDEGVAYLKDEERISYQDIVSNYSGNCQSYICCFTILYENDFDKTGKIKESVATCLQLTNNLDKQRDAVIFSLQPRYNLLNTLETIHSQTIEFINRDIKKPPFESSENGIQIFPTNNKNEFSANLFKIDRQLALDFQDSCEKDGIPRCFDSNMLSYLNKNNMLEDEVDKTDVTFKATKIDYNPNKIPFNDKKCFLDYLKSGNATLKDMNFYLKICLGEKKYKYASQNEYRILVTEFRETNVFPSAVKVSVPKNNSQWWAKVVKYDDIRCIKISDFQETNGDITSETIRYEP